MIPDLSSYTFSAVMDYPPGMPVLDLSDGCDTDAVSRLDWAIGRYNEKRKRMYTAPQYRGKRDIHMGIDIWTASGRPVYAFHEGEVAYLADHRQTGNYGPTIVTRHRIGTLTLYALYGHLSRSILRKWKEGDPVEAGERLGEIGSPEVNGSWAPHLHFQLSLKDPGEADMPGVVAKEDHEEATRTYPDPRVVLGELYK